MASHICQEETAVVSKQLDYTLDVDIIHDVENEKNLLMGESRNDSEDEPEDPENRESVEIAHGMTRKAEVPIKHINIRRDNNCFEFPTYVSTGSTEGTSTSSSSQTDYSLKTCSDFDSQICKIFYFS